MKVNFYSKGQSLIGIIIALVVVGLITGGLYYYFQKQIPEVPEITEKPAEEEIAEPEEEILEEEIKEEVKPEELKEPVPIQRTEYIVVVKKNSIFKNQAERFSNYKKADLVTYNQNFNEILNTLKDKKPIYLALFVTPEELIPDFIDNVDLSLRDLDSDPYLDVAYGIITSRNKEELKKYVDRLIAHSPTSRLNIYGVSPPYLYRDLEPYYGILIKTNCLTNCVGAFCLCNDADRATIERIQSNLKNANIFVIYAHGSPSSISLDNGEAIKGSSNDIYGYTPQPSEKIDLTHNTILTIAGSCLTGRIEGKPTSIDLRFDSGVEGNTNTSLVLGFLQSGSLNYIGSSYIVICGGEREGLEPKETIIDESILQNVPIGIALKDLKNRYLVVLEKYKVPMEGSPIMTDNFTKDAVSAGVKTWILFGDPSIVLSTKSYQPINCIQEYSEQQIGNRKEVRVKIRFEKEIGGKIKLINNSGYIDKLIEENPGEFGAQGASVCVIKTKYEGRLKEVNITSLSGIQDRYGGGSFPGNIFTQDLGDEVFLQVPWYVAIGGLGGSISLNYEIISE